MDQQQENRVKLQHLLQQLEMTGDEYIRHFEHATLERVNVHKKSRVWQFTIQIESVLPIDVFMVFQERIRQAFSAIATIRLQFKTRSEEVDEVLIGHYWPFVIEALSDMSPPIRQRLTGQQPTIVGRKMTIQCVSVLEQQTLRQKYQELITDVYSDFGFPKIAMEVQMVESAEDEEAVRQAFLRERAEEEAAFARQALEDLQKRENDRKNNPQAASGPFLLGAPIKNDEPLMDIQQIQDEERSVVIEGYVFDAEIRELRSGRSLLTIKMTDYTDSIVVKMFSRNDEDAAQMANLKKGMWVRARGGIQNDTFIRDLIMMAQSIMEIKPVIKKDLGQEDRKRIELHAHTMMSQMDGLVSAGALVEQAAKWGHPAIAITDHGNVQSFPEAYGASKKHGIKVLYGMEANLVDDGVPIAYGEAHRFLEDETYVVFDVETTGLSAVYNTIIELAGVKIKNGEIIDRFESFANPHHPISELISNLTGITDDMVVDAPEVSEVVKDYHEWVGDAILVAHNASFDMGFLYEAYKKAEIPMIEYAVIDTLELARFLHPEMGNHRLNTLAKKYNIELTQHHRAIYDAEATGYLFLKLLEQAAQKGIVYHDQFNDHVGGGDAYKRARPSHCTLIAKNEEGIKNLYQLVSASHIDYFYRVPRIPRSLLTKHREGLIIGSGCSNGEVFEGLMQKSVDEVEEIAKFYDYLEIHPKALYAHLIELELVRDEWSLEDIMRKMVKLGKKLDIPVCATGNVHYLHETDANFREILVRSQGGANMLNRHELPKAHFRTTDEMLQEFAFLGEHIAEEIVIDSPRQVVEQVGDVKPLKDGLFTPEIPGANEDVKELTYAKAHAIYGENLPEIVTARIEKELKSIIGHNFSVIYLISHKLVKQSLDDGYLVGSRGSVGSSLVATMMDITEVNPLPPHYVCPTCKQVEFFDDGSISSGYDLPDKDCPNCEIPLTKDGQDIPFETFLGFEGDKVPDIDLSAPRC